MLEVFPEPQLNVAPGVLETAVIVTLVTAQVKFGGVETDASGALMF